MKIDWNHLKHLSKMETEEDARTFDYKVWEIAAIKDVTLLENLINLFDDECPYYEVMYSLVHAIETYPKDVYVPVLLKNIENGVEKYQFWIDCLCNRIFNDENYKELFIKNMHLAPKESLLKLFDLMEKESPHHKELLQELREKLEEKKGG